MQFFLFFFHFTISSLMLCLWPTCSMISDSWFAFCFAYSVENGSQRNRFIDFESSIHGRPPRLGWTDSGRVLLCNPGRPHSNTNTTQIFENSIIIVDEGPRVDAGLTLICCSCFLRSELLLYWCQFQIFIALSQLSLFWRNLNYILYFHHWKLVLLCQTRKQQLFYGNFYKDTVIIIWTCQHKRN